MFEGAKFDASQIGKIRETFVRGQFVLVDQYFVGLRKRREHCNHGIPSIAVTFRHRGKHSRANFEPSVELVALIHVRLGADNGRFLRHRPERSEQCLN
ncbi:hypothetical protein RBWH47_00213 [Rhodopirellula baltica WH47]|uniref:Uncharacterized protein n=1 Tax=Rhodopirellula baltica WH47 TaxID=991778 RepID=F2AWZ6_RHOBT|nr:hypothetical protein RBWH47_00213 [Rhodopirellula baltica WH47]